MIKDKVGYGAYGSDDNNSQKEGSEEEDANYELVDSDYDLIEDNDDEIFEIFVDKDIERDRLTVKGKSHAIEDDVNSDNTEYAPSDVLLSCSETDEDDTVSSKFRYPEFNQEDVANPCFEVGMKFRSFEQFKRAVRNYGIRTRFNIKFNPNNKTKCKAICAKGCPFYIYAAHMVTDKRTVQIKSGIFEHSCSMEHEIKNLNAAWIAANYLESFRADPTWKIEGIIQAVKSNQEVEISRMKAWRAREIALKEIDGNEKEQIARLHDYRLELLRSNPGTTVKFQLENGVFKGMYVCLGALKVGFLEVCRPLISLDGTFLKGRYGGQLLAAVGIDANDCIYPVAWSIAEKENKENWLWFLDCLATDLDISDNIHWSFMSDRQKGLIPAIEQMFPNAEHRFCVRHILTNFSQRFNGKDIKELLWNAARASYVPLFSKVMEEIAALNKPAYEYLNKIPPHHWSRSHFQVNPKCDVLLNNLCESFNSTILDARLKGVITMNEIIRNQLMKGIQRKRDWMRRNGGEYCPKILVKLEKSNALSWMYTCIWGGEHKYQVTGPGGQFVVDKKERVCSCRRWDLTGIPCCHAVTAIYYNNENPEKYLHDCYKIETYLKIYSNVINPTNGKDLWPKSDLPPIIPPEPKKAKKGKKTLMRRKEAEELEKALKRGRVSKKDLVITCSICGEKGHNRRFHDKNGTNGGTVVPPRNSTATEYGALPTRNGSANGEGSVSVRSRSTKLPVMRNRSQGKSSGSKIHANTHTMQWMPDGSTRYPDASSNNNPQAQNQSQPKSNGIGHTLQWMPDGSTRYPNSSRNTSSYLIPEAENQRQHVNLIDGIILDEIMSQIIDPTPQTTPNPSVMLGDQMTGKISITMADLLHSASQVNSCSAKAAVKGGSSKTETITVGSAKLMNISVVKNPNMKPPSVKTPTVAGIHGTIISQRVQIKPPAIEKGKKDREATADKSNTDKGKGKIEYGKEDAKKKRKIWKL